MNSPTMLNPTPDVVLRAAASSRWLRRAITRGACLAAPDEPDIGALLAHALPR